MCAVRCPIRVEVKDGRAGMDRGQPAYPRHSGQPVRQGLGRARL
ncbi:MAG: hypothetical protein MZV70_39615 [Desulfobacterales bacterium]|nr:hypothetical protein [Desulfobacterales bacterium]